MLTRPKMLWLVLSLLVRNRAWLDRDCLRQKPHVVRHQSAPELAVGTHLLKLEIPTWPKLRLSLLWKPSIPTTHLPAASQSTSATGFQQPTLIHQLLTQFPRNATHEPIVRVVISAAYPTPLRLSRTASPFPSSLAGICIGVHDEGRRQGTPHLHLTPRAFSVVWEWQLLGSVRDSSTAVASPSSPE